MTAPTGQQPADTQQDPSAALLALEGQLRDGISGDVADTGTHLWAILAAAIAAGGVYSAVQILSRPDVHAALVRLLGASQNAVAALVTAGYTAATQLGRAIVAGELGADIPTVLPTLGGTSATLTADVTRAFAQALPDIQSRVTAAHDGIRGEDPTAARLLAAKAALDAALGRLSDRLDASGVYAVHQGATDAQAALYAQYGNSHGGVTLGKEWVVQSDDPCAWCAALDGTVIPVDQQFSHDAGNADAGRVLPVYEGLDGPPRHPNCRCRLRVKITNVS